MNLNKLPLCYMRAYHDYMSIDSSIDLAHKGMSLSDYRIYEAVLQDLYNHGKTNVFISTPVANRLSKMGFTLQNVDGIYKITTNMRKS